MANIPRKHIYKNIWYLDHYLFGLQWCDGAHIWMYVIANAT